MKSLGYVSNVGFYNKLNFPALKNTLLPIWDIFILVSSFDLEYVFLRETIQN